ncbi:MAG: Fic family protein [Paludibacteraceae bacterium]|nr:Fic family protein [Paludibacteraceae bacterium]
MNTKISIRFFNDREVRAIWDDEKSQWWFSVLDIVGAITESPNPRKYWSVLKTRLKKSGNELTTRCSQLKLTASDGKKYATDCFAQDDIQELAKVIPSKKSQAFLDWFTYSDNSIDGQSRKKAYTFIESNLVADSDVGTVKALQQIHAYIFGGLYDFAGKIRTKTISKGGTMFCLAEYLHDNLKKIEQMPQNTFDEIVSKYVEMNIAHPFMEGNGRSARIWLDLIFKKSLRKCVDWSQIDKNDYLNAMQKSIVDDTEIRSLLRNALTDKIDDRELFMKGIDYSYYYEQND